MSLGSLDDLFLQLRNEPVLGCHVLLESLELFLCFLVHFLQLVKLACLLVKLVDVDLVFFNDFAEVFLDGTDLFVFLLKVRDKFTDIDL